MKNKIQFNSSNRIYFKKDRLCYWIGIAVNKADGQKSLARKTDINQNNLHCYLNKKTISIRGDILQQIIDFLKINNIEIDELLKDIEKITPEKEYSKKTIAVARKALLKKYGKNAFAYIQSKSCEALSKRYGNDYMKVLSKKGNQKLLEKYGENAFKIITSRGFESMKRKYGKGYIKTVSSLAFKKLKIKHDDNWRSVLGKINHLKRKRKYGNDYLQKRIAKTHEEAPLTEQEEKIAILLNKKDISYVAHCIIENYLECDFLIPNKENSKICIEASTVTPQSSNLYRKIAQIFLRKAKLPNCKFIFITSKSKQDKKQTWHARPDLIKFLLDEGIFVFWNYELNKVIKCINSILNYKNTQCFIEEKYQWCQMHFKERQKHAVLSAQKEAKRLYSSEREMKNIFNLKGKKKVIFNEYDWPIVSDIVEGNCLYEITNAKTHSALEVISGKLLYLNKTLPGFHLNLILLEDKKFPTRELIEEFCKINQR